MSIGTDGYAEGTNVVALGASSRAIGVNGMAYGSDARAEGTNVSAFGTGAWATGVGSTAIGPRAYAFGVQTLSVGAYSSAEVAYASAFGPGATARAFGSTAIGMNAVTTRPFEVSIGSAYSPYSLPGLHPNGFVGDRYQKPGEKRFVTTDQNGTLGTTSYSPDQVVASIGAVGALSAAMGSVPVTTLLPDESVRCGVGTGTYGGQYAGSLGCAAKVANRLFFNGGVAMTATDTVNNGAMGRLGFSIGFGGAPKKAKQAELAAIPTMNMGGNSLFELGNSTGAQGAGEAAAVMAKTTAPAVIAAKAAETSVHANQAQETEELRARLAELEDTIAELSREQPEDGQTEPELAAAYARAMEALEKLTEEKQQLEDELTGKLNEQGIQIAEQRAMLLKQQQMLNALLKKIGDDSITAPSN
ncbi:yadA-like C-terminal region family protein [Synechococcus sp. Minos11]|uniref:YadA-like family protein n=1 Tax=Synechococcus sp. Minos11 TaxID=221341 RepID=UPI0016458830|nr:YadA-like family protein [Synechococcus sp. Minos11]QNJ08167.1 yadA-like C-terminal region family protein [Synechococcus sp. Minos11]